nr:MAG: hypothetical protein DIU78_00610 [Pseudomonadota bacterium]
MRDLLFHRLRDERSPCCWRGTRSILSATARKRRSKGTGELNARGRPPVRRSDIFASFSRSDSRCPATSREFGAPLWVVGRLAVPPDWREAEGPLLERGAGVPFVASLAQRTEGSASDSP